LTVRQALDHAREILSESNIEDSPLEAELLLRHTLNINRVQLYLNIDLELTPRQEKTFFGLVQRCLKHEPTAYITGHKEFYGLDFKVNPNVLIPRPESELLVEKAIELAGNQRQIIIADVGTGSGAIAISLAINLPQATVYATDISVPALEVALANCRIHGVEDRVNLLEGNLLDPLPEPVNLIIANLPYVTESELTTAYQLKSEPPLALNGGADGIEKIRLLCVSLKGKLNPGGSLLLEIGQGQREALATFLNELFPTGEIEVTKDLAGINRVVKLTLL